MPNSFKYDYIDKQKGIYSVRVASEEPYTREEAKVVYVAKMIVRGEEIEDVEVQGYLPEEVKRDAIAILLDCIYLEKNNGFVHDTVVDKEPTKASHLYLVDNPKGYT